MEMVQTHIHQAYIWKERDVQEEGGRANCRIKLLTPFCLYFPKDESFPDSEVCFRPVRYLLPVCVWLGLFSVLRQSHWKPECEFRVDRIRFMPS